MQIPSRWSIESLYEVHSTKLYASSPATHWHSHFLINLITEGRGVQIINGVQHQLERGCIVLLSPLDFHKNIISDGESLHYDALSFSDSVFFESFNELCSLENLPIVLKLGDEDFSLALKLFALLLNEYEHPEKLGTKLFALSLIRELVILILRNVSHISLPSKQDDRVRRSLIYIHSHFQKPITVSDVAEHVGYSSNYFSCIFKKQMGASPLRYRSEKRRI